MVAAYTKDAEDSGRLNREFHVPAYATHSGKETG